MGLLMRLLRRSDGRGSGYSDRSFLCFWEEGQCQANEAIVVPGTLKGDCTRYKPNLNRCAFPAYLGGMVFHKLKDGFARIPILYFSLPFNYP